MESVSIRLSPDDLAKVDELRGEGVSRSAFVRELLRRAGPLDEGPSYEEALILLAKSARGGKVAAQVALERALRASDGVPEPDNELARLLRG
ncbi:MAG: ribbon-helix-helix domain-containing protein [Actinomycetota bacterium]